LAEKLFKRVSPPLHRQGLSLHSGTIVDATIIKAPSATRNADGERDPETHQAKRGRQWFRDEGAHWRR
jgi:IS5 family transposase